MHTKDSPVNVPRKQLPNILEEFKSTSIEANLDIKTTLLTIYCLLENNCLWTKVRNHCTTASFLC